MILLLAIFLELTAGLVSDFPRRAAVHRENHLGGQMLSTAYRMHMSMVIRGSLGDPEIAGMRRLRKMTVYSSLCADDLVRCVGVKRS